MQALPANGCGFYRSKTKGNNTLKKILLVAASLAALSSPAMAAPGNSDQADGTATAEVVAPITITHAPADSLNFGIFTAGTAGGLITVPASGVTTAGGDVTLLTGSTETADYFTVSGDAGRSFSISAGNGTVDSGANSMSFTTLSALSGTLDGTGSAGIFVGGTLSVGASQAPGVYTGTYTVTVAYN